MPLTEKELKQIREAADRLYPLPYPELEGSKINREMEDLQQAHITAVTAEREKVSGLLQASEKIKTWILTHPRKATIHRPIIDEFVNAINQYNQ